MKSEHIIEKQPPYLTFCPWPIKKNPNLSYTEADFINNTFEMNEILFTYFLANNSEQKTYSWKETKSVYYGRCYTIQRKVGINYLDAR